MDTRHNRKKEVYKLELDALKAVGPDKMSPWILLERVLSETLAKIYNESMDTRQLPKDLEDGKCSFNIK